MINEKNTFPQFDEAGNMIAKKPEIINKVKKLEKEFNEIVNGKKFHCQYCDKEWDNDISRVRHESWCVKNPDHRKYYRKPESEVKNPKKKVQTKSKTKISKENNIIKELRNFDKTFGLTDEQIVKYIRNKIKG